jgi:hypothetical protein
MDIDGIIYFSTPTFTVGLIVKDKVIVDGPPFARNWAVGRPAQEIWDQGKARGATVLWLPAKYPGAVDE